MPSNAVLDYLNMEALIKSKVCTFKVFQDIVKYAKCAQLSSRKVMPKIS